MKLEPCPFCGNSNLTRRYEEQFVWVECGDCEMQGPVASHVSYAEGYWNRRFSPSAPPPPEVVGVPREVAEAAIRALRRDMNFGYEMAENWYQKGPFSSVDKGNAAHDFAKRCEEQIATLQRALSTGKASAP